MLAALASVVLGENMEARELDQFYTREDIAVMCVSNLVKILPRLQAEGQGNKWFFVEPSAGGGAFLRALKAVPDTSKCRWFACDIDPHEDAIEKKDFLKDDISQFLPSGGRVVVLGNPPFGKKGKLAAAFINKGLEYSSIVGFILPIQFNKFSGHNQIVQNARLVFNEPLPADCFIFKGKPYSVRCCFQVWTTAKTEIPDLRLKSSPKTKHPDFEMYQYNCTEEASKFFDKKAYGWDFAVPRQGFKDYTVRETDPLKLDRHIQWIFFKAKNDKVLARLMKLDFVELSQKNSTIPGFGKADVVEEYERRYPVADRKSVVGQMEFDLEVGSKK